MIDEFSDSSLVLVGHGSSANAGSAAPTYQHAAALRARGGFAGIHEAFWQQEPRIRDVVGRITSPRVFVVPMFIGEGYFTREVIPRELGLPPEEEAEFPRVLVRGGRVLAYCAPVGTHPLLAQVLLARARDIVRRHPPPRRAEPADTTLFLAGHGTGRSDHSRKAIELQAERLRARCRYADVRPIFMEEEPRIEDCYELATTRHLVIVPCFISDGLHTTEDIPARLGEAEANIAARRARGEGPWPNPTERRGKLVWYTASIGTEPRLPEVILERVREAAGQLGRAGHGIQTHGIQTF